MEAYRITALVFSGRENPSWALPEDQLPDAFRRWSLAPDTDNSSPEYILGYNGLMIQQGAQSWHIHKEMIIYRSQNSIQAAKKDTGREIEKKLLATAPPEIATLLTNFLSQEL